MIYILRLNLYFLLLFIMFCSAFQIYIPKSGNHRNIKECNIPYGINNPQCIDVVFDGGAFNGGMGLGVALYLKELERANRIRVSRVFASQR